MIRALCSRSKKALGTLPHRGFICNFRTDELGMPITNECVPFASLRRCTSSLRLCGNLYAMVMDRTAVAVLRASSVILTVLELLVALNVRCACHPEMLHAIPTFTPGYHYTMERAVRRIESRAASLCFFVKNFLRFETVPPALCLAHPPTKARYPVVTAAGPRDELGEPLHGARRRGVKGFPHCSIDFIFCHVAAVMVPLNRERWRRSPPRRLRAMRAHLMRVRVFGR
jgi:hypothetical protein